MIDLHSFKMPKLKEEDCDREAIKKAYIRQECHVAVKKLKKNNALI